MSAIKKLVSQTAIYGIPTIIGRFLNFILVPLYTQKFLPEEYGVVTTLYAFVSFLNIVLSYGMETAYFRFSSGKLETHTEKDIAGSAFFSLLLSSSLFLLINFLLSSSIADWLRIGEHPEYIIYFSLILFFDTLSIIPFARLRQQLKAFSFAGIKMFNILTNVLLNLFFIVWAPKLIENGVNIPSWIYQENIGIGYIFISNLLASFLSFLLLIPQLIIKVKINRNLLIRELLNYGFPLIWVGLAGMVNETLDRILLNYLLDESIAAREVGIYGACYKLSLVITLFIQAFRFAAEPFFFAQAKEKNSKNTYAVVMNYFVWVCGLILAASLLFTKELGALFLRNEAYFEGLKILPLLLWANLFLGIYYNLSIWYKLSDKNKIGAKISLIGAALTLILNFILIPFMGYYGAALATMLVYLVMMLISFYQGKKHYPVPYDIKFLLIYLGLNVPILWVSQLNYEGVSGILVRVLLIGLIALAGLILMRKTAKFQLNS